MACYKGTQPSFFSSDTAYYTRCEGREEMHRLLYSASWVQTQLWQYYRQTGVSPMMPLQLQSLPEAQVTCALG